MSTTKPNVVLILNDDMGYSDLGCYGGEIRTPHLDRLAANGLRFSSFYNTARCSPSRASMLTGLHPHQTGVGILTYDSGPEGYAGNLNHQCVTIPQVLKANGYRTYMSGKWHVASSLVKPTDTWPLQRGFDAFYGTIIGAGSFYDPNTLTRGNENVEQEAHAEGFFYTDAISDQAVEYIERHAKQHAGTPFFEYVAYTAPHWPLHAHDEDIAKYRGRFDAGWDALREERLDKLVAKKRKQKLVPAQEMYRNSISKCQRTCAAVGSALMKPFKVSPSLHAWWLRPRRRCGWRKHATTLAWAASSS